MPWVRMDDQYPEHPKVVAAGHLAGWLDVCAWAYCNRALTDGFVADAMVPRLTSVPKPMVRADELVAVGRWERVPGGFQIHDYLGYQKEADQIRKERAQAKSRQAKFRNHGRSNGVTPPVTNGVNDAPVTPSPLPHPPSRDLQPLTSSTEAERDTPPPLPTEDQLAAVRAIKDQHRGRAS